MSEWEDVSKWVTYGMAVAVSGLAVAAEALGGGRGAGATEDATVPAVHAAYAGADAGGGGGWQGKGDAGEGGAEKPTRAGARQMVARGGEVGVGDLLGEGREVSGGRSC